MIVDIPSRQGHGVSARLRLRLRMRLRTLFEKARVDIRICHSEESLQMISNSRERDLGGCEKRPQIASDVDWAGKRATAKINTLTWPSGYERPGQLIARAAKSKQKAFSSLKRSLQFCSLSLPLTYFNPISLFLCNKLLTSSHPVKAAIPEAGTLSSKEAARLNQVYSKSHVVSLQIFCQFACN